jgi:hypothetical protein
LYASFQYLPLGVLLSFFAFIDGFFLRFRAAAGRQPGACTHAGSLVPGVLAHCTRPGLTSINAASLSLEQILGGISAAHAAGA